MISRKSLAIYIMMVVFCAQVYLVPQAFAAPVVHSSVSAITSRASTVSRASSSSYQLINASSLVGKALSITSGMTYVIDLTQPGSSMIDLIGNLKNGGTIYIVSTNPLIKNVTIFANNVFNKQNALLTTVLPSGGLAGISGDLPQFQRTVI